MSKYKIVYEIKIEDRLFNTYTVENNIKSLEKAKKIADIECERFFNNPYFNTRDDGLDEYHSWKVYDEQENCVYEAY